MTSWKTGSFEYEHVRWAADAVYFHVCEVGTTNGKSEWPTMYRSGSGHMDMHIRLKRSIDMPASAGFGDADASLWPAHVAEMSGESRRAMVPVHGRSRDTARDGFSHAQQPKALAQFARHTARCSNPKINGNPSTAVEPVCRALSFRNSNACCAQVVICMCDRRGW
jgi:hypothetical protein